MKYIKQLIAGLCLGTIALGCNQQKNEPSENTYTDTISPNGVSTLAAGHYRYDSLRKFIRTADLKFKVNNVVQSAYAIEDMVNRQQGYIAQSNLSSTTNNSDAIALGDDSLLESSSVSATNSMVIRVPDFRLDNLLKEIAAQVQFLDYRVIQSDDVSLQLLSDKLLQQRTEKTVARLDKTIDKDTGNSGEKMAFEQSLQNNLMQNDNAVLNSLAIQDKVNFSTIHLSVYQRETVLYERVSNRDIFKKFEQGFGEQCRDAIISGWAFLKTVTVFLLRLWGLFLFFALGFILYKRIRPALH